MKLQTRNREAGMSFIQMIATVAVIGIFSGLAAWKMSDVKDTAQEQKLGTQVASLNAAVKLYLSSGGSLENVSGAQQVVDKMKSMASNADKIAGFTGTLIDPRLKAVEQSDEEAAVSGELRVFWDDANQLFIIADSGQAGIKAFEIDSTETPQTIQVEERETQFELSATDATSGAWVWDFDGSTSSSASPYRHHSWRRHEFGYRSKRLARMLRRSSCSLRLALLHPHSTWMSLVLWVRQSRLRTPTRPNIPSSWYLWLVLIGHSSKMGVRSPCLLAVVFLSLLT